MTTFPRVQLPLTPDAARRLKLGDAVLADGEAVVTAGLPTHERIVRCLDTALPLPLELRGQAFFHLGLCGAEQDGETTPLYVNPTTSTRFAAQLPTMIRRLGLTTVAGKGGLDQASVDAMAEQGCVYMAIVGGAAPLLTAAITEVVETRWDDLIAQFRLTRIRFRGFGPLTIAIDAHGGNLYGQLADAARQRLPAILSGMASQRQ